jgi:CRISPR system Cascade subunit CasD
MDILLLRFDAPLMSFGGPIIDNHGIIQPYPALSMISGLLANALGYDHGEYDAIQRLQARLEYASRQDQKAIRLRDYQTVDLGQESMSDDLAWTTWGYLERRRGGSAGSGTQIRLRDYWADAIYTVALTLNPADESPKIDDLQQALIAPERPLFIGRKACLPAARIMLGRVRAGELLDPLRDAKWAKGTGVFPAWWPTSPGNEANRRPVTDTRDWANQIHVGERWIAMGKVDVTIKESEDV